MRARSDDVDGHRRADADLRAAGYVVARLRVHRALHFALRSECDVAAQSVDVRTGIDDGIAAGIDDDDCQRSRNTGLAAGGAGSGIRGEGIALVVVGLVNAGVERDTP